MSGELDRVAAAFAGADADALFERQDKDFAVADLAGFAGAAAAKDGVDGRLDEVVVNCDLQLHFAEEIRLELGTAEGFDLAALASKTLAIEHGQAENLDFGERFLNRFEPVGLNDRDDELHDGRARSFSPSRGCQNLVLREKRGNRG